MITYHSESPNGIRKPGFVISSQIFQNGPGDLPCVGVVKSIITDPLGLWWVRVKFPYDCGYISTFRADRLTSDFDERMFDHGNWGFLPGYLRQWRNARLAAGLPELPGWWAEDFLPVPSEFYAGRA